MSFSLLGVRIDSLSRDLLEQILTQKFLGDKFFQISTVNPEFLVYGRSHSDFVSLLEKTDLHVCDGSGIEIWSRFLYGQNIVRIPGVSVAEIACSVAAKNNHSVFLLGGFGGYAEKSADYLKKKYPDIRICGTASDVAWDDVLILDTLKSLQPALILVAFGAPKQEIWLQKYGLEIPSLRVGIGVGGTFDFWGGKIRRAPLVFQKLGIEWFFRLFQEPRKRFKRIWNAVFVFSFLVLRDRFFS